jgi:hypothetical protein
LKNTILFALLILLGTITSCKKWQKQYPEDTERTKLNPTERLINKTWVFNIFHFKYFKNHIFKIYFNSLI